MNFLKMGALVVPALATMAMSAHASPCNNGYEEGSSGIVAGVPLTLHAVIAEVRRVSPEVRTAGLEARALAAEAEQAGRRLNPALSVEVENFAGGGVFSGFNQSETTIALEQTFRLGDKRNLAQRAARARQALASAECALVLREAELEAALLFSELAAAVRIYELANDAAELAGTLTDTVEKRVKAGAAAPPELARAKADSAALKAAAIVAGAEVERGQYALAALWGRAEFQFLPPQLSEPASASVPTEDALSSHPRLTAAKAITRARRAEYEAARAGRLPDVTITAGVRRFEDTDENAIVAGFSVPLPLFDRNRGNITAADIRANASTANHAAIEARLLADQRTAVSLVHAAESSLAILTDEALPAAEEAYAAAIRGYAVGKFDLTTTLDARATLINARVAVIQAILARQIHDLRLRSLINAAPFDGEK